MLRLCEELATRKATITEFFLAYVYSNTDNIQANLLWLDFTRLKRAAEEARKKNQQQATIIEKNEEDDDTPNDPKEQKDNPKSNHPF